MKKLTNPFFLAILPMAIAFTANAQVKPAPVLKLDTVLLRKQLKPQPQISFARHDLSSTPAPTVAPASVVKTSLQITPKFQFKSNVVVNQSGSIHPTPLPTTTFQPVIITSPGGTVSSINSQGLIVKKN